MGFRLLTTTTCLTSLGLVVAGHAGLASGVACHPFSLAPSIVVEPSDRLRLDQGEIVVEVLPGRDSPNSGYSPQQGWTLLPRH